jgi:signal transduction histidine kinase
MTTRPLNVQYLNRWLLLAMLLLLHLALWLGVNNMLTRPLLFVHLGLFLMWQPLWRGEREIRSGGIIAILCASIVALWWLNWWLLAFWISGLFALVGGRVFASATRWMRLPYMVVMVYLLVLQLFWVMPHLFAPDAITETTFSMISLLVPVVAASALFVPRETDTVEARRTVDFIYSLLLFLLLVLLVLGSLSFMTIKHVNYFEALLRTLFSIALLLFTLGWLWNPRFGFGGLQPLFSRYLLNVGTPFEGWLRRLADTAQTEPNPASFLAKATRHLSELPWLSGLRWQTGSGSGSLGSPSAYPAEINERDLRLTLYARQAISPSVLLHINLLGQLLADFYQAKQREQRLREMAHLQAVYETGARLTHDLKNILQSLLGLISVARQDREASIQAVQRQLPTLAQRIELVLDKLKTPQAEEDAAMLPLAGWWQNLRHRHQHADLAWELEGELTDRPVPAALFDSVADNLIENVLAKRQQQPGIGIRVILRAEPPRLAVCDAGHAIPAPLAEQLLHTVVPSETGLGIGLYQAARWARQLGYQMMLSENREGRVCFALEAAAGAIPGLTDPKPDNP